MTPHSLQTLQSSLQALPVAMVFSSQLLLPQKSSVSANSSTPEQEEEILLTRATYMTALLKNIHGYDHSRINE